MAVNLKATATLNIKPYMASLKTLAAENAKLNATAVKGNATNAKGLDGLITQHVRASKVATAGAEKTNQSYQKTNRTFKQGSVDLGAYANSLNSVQRTARGVTAEYSKMTPAIARLTDAKENLARSENRLAREAAQGLAGPAYDKLHERVIRDAKAVGKAQAAIERELNNSLDKQASVRDASRLAAERRVNTALNTLSKQQATERLNSEKQLNKSLDTLAKQRATERIATEKQLNKALDAERTRQMAARGAANAATFKQSLAGMTAEEAALAQARNRVLTAEQKLARAYTIGSGIAAAESGLIRAEQGYRKLASAQEAVAKGIRPASSGLAAQRYLYHDVSRQALGLGLALGAIPAAAITVGAIWENQFANVLRTSDPLVRGSEMRVNALRESLVNMAKTMPMSFGAITEIATLGNQMGVQAHELDSFTKSVAMFSATSGVAVEESATAFGRLRTVAADAAFSYQGVADSILKVGVNSVATEKEIIDVTTQISSIAAGAGFTTQEMIGLSGALASVRVPPELSRSIITRTFGQFDKAIQKNGTELSTLARVSGRSVEDIKKHWGGPGAGDIFVDFAEGLRKSGRQAREELKSLGITSVRDVPALLRLANAADSTGKSGGLLKQTIYDAKNAAGEVQEQYAVMAETVVGRLKVLGNSVLSFFNSLGNSSNGFVKGAIDGLTNMFQFMDKMADNPFSSWSLGAMAALSSIALVTAGIAKMTAGFKMFQHVGEVVGARNFFDAIGMSKKGGGGADMSPVLAGTASLINNFKTGVKSAGATWRNFGNTISSTASWVVAERHIKNTGLGFRTLGDSIKAGAREVPKATGVMGNLARFGLHPVTLGLAAVATVGAVAYNSWAKGFYKATTSTEDLASSLSKIDLSSAGEVSKVLRTINIDGRELRRWGTSGITPFKGGMPELMGNIELLADYKAEMAAVDKMHSRYKKNIRNSINRRYEGMGLDGKATEAGLKNLDSAFKEMRAAGNDAGVTAFWSQISKNAGSSAKSANRMRTLLKDMPEEAEALTRQFALQGMSLEKGLNNWGRFSRDARDLAAEFDGASVIADAFNLDDDSAAQFGKTMNEAAAAFIDFGAALEAGTQVDDNGVFQSFDLGEFNKSLTESMEVQNQWMADVRTLSTKTTPDAIEALAAMGPAGKHLAREIAAGLGSTDKGMRELAQSTLDTLDAAARAEKIDAAGMAAEYNNVLSKAARMLNIDDDVTKALSDKVQKALTPDDWGMLSDGINKVLDKHGDELGDELGARLFDGLNKGVIGLDDFQALTNVFGNIGVNASRSLMDAIDSGISMEQIQARIQRMEEPRIKVKIEPETEAAYKLQNDFTSLLIDKNIPVPVNFDVNETSIGEFRDLIGQPDLFGDLPDAKLGVSLADAYDEISGFRNWALANGIDVEVIAHPDSALLTLNALQQVSEGTVLMTQLDTIDMASDKFYEFVTAADGKTVIVEINAENGEATNKVWELDTAIEGSKAKPIEADTDNAVAAIEEVNAMAEAATTSEHTIKSNVDDVADDIDTKLQGRNTTSVHTVTRNEVRGSKVEEANGGVLQFYANGGVRENHVAQIAPAGTMRVWAEPETGGEAYIPLAQSKRVRSEAILDDVANRFGYSLQPQNYTKYADGGHYMAQVMSRQRVAVSTSRGVGGDAKVNIGSVNFEQANQTDQFREFSRHMNRIARGL